MSDTNEPECLHETVWMGLCTECGAPASGPIAEYATAGFVSLDSGLKVKRSRLTEMEAETFSQLVEQRKCVLVLDLDHTLVHATAKLSAVNAMKSRDLEILPLEQVVKSGKAIDENKAYWFCTSMVLKDAGVDRAISESEDSGGQAAGANSLAHPADEGAALYLKLRPGSLEFLSRASRNFQLYVYTHGTLDYASVVLQALDPTGSLFRGRVIARESNRSGKSLVRLFPTEHKLVLVMDDRSDVWEDAEDNLIRVSPYLFWPEDDRSKIGIEGMLKRRRVLDQTVASSPLFPESDRQLPHLTPILDSLVANTYYESEITARPPDVRPHLLDLRARTLSGLKIATTGIVPLNLEISCHPVTLMIQSLGGRAIWTGEGDGEDDRNFHETAHLTADVVIASNPETRKAKEALDSGIPVVDPLWLLHAEAALQLPAIESFSHEIVSDTVWVPVKCDDDEATGDDLLSDLLGDNGEAEREET